MNRRLLTLAVCALVAMSLAGCSTQTPAPAENPSSAADAEHISPEKTTEPIAGLTDMPAAQKTSELNSKFVTEWPVVAAMVLSSDTVSENELRFVLAVNAPAASVEKWYRTVMQGRAFVLQDETRADDGTVSLTFMRAGLTYLVAISPVNDTTTRVVSTLRSASDSPTP